MNRIYYFGNKQSNNILLQMIGEHEVSSLDSETELIKKLALTDDFCLAAIKTDNWNNDLSPWKAPAAYGDEDFGGGAEVTLEKLINIIKSEILTGRKMSEINLYIGGYSLSGLFSLWSAFQTDIFKGIAAVSPSVWYPDFYEYVQKNQIMTEKVYLSLGKKEEKTRNPVMSTVGKAIKDIFELLSQDTDCVLEWNEGNHFKEPDLRTAKGFAWLLNRNIESEG